MSRLPANVAHNGSSKIGLTKKAFIGKVLKEIEYITLKLTARSYKSCERIYKFSTLWYIEQDCEDLHLANETLLE